MSDFSPPAGDVSECWIDRTRVHVGAAAGGRPLPAGRESGRSSGSTGVTERTAPAPEPASASAIVRELARAHGGEALAENVAPHGTGSGVLLPRPRPAASGPGAGPAHQVGHERMAARSMQLGSALAATSTPILGRIGRSPR